jgi:hypothetical protein
VSSSQIFNISCGSSSESTASAPLLPLLSMYFRLPSRRQLRHHITTEKSTSTHAPMLNDHATAGGVCCAFCRSKDSCNMVAMVIFAAGVAQFSR